jgi:hypothetical protein
VTESCLCVLPRWSLGDRCIRGLVFARGIRNCMHRYSCMYVYICVCRCIHMYIYIYIYIYTHTHTHTFRNVYVFMVICVYTYALVVFSAFFEKVVSKALY